MMIGWHWDFLSLSFFFQSSTPPSPPLQPKNAFPITLIYATIITTHPGYKYHDQKVLRTPQEFWLSPISKLEPERGGKGRPERVGEELIDWESILKSSSRSRECAVSSDHQKQRGVKSSFPFKNTSNMLFKKYLHPPKSAPDRKFLCSTYKTRHLSSFGRDAFLPVCIKWETVQSSLLNTH